MKFYTFSYLILLLLILGSCGTTREEDKRAIGNIEFGVSSAAFNGQIDSLLKTLKKGTDTAYMIGKFPFTEVVPEFDQDLLISISLRGAIIEGYSRFIEVYDLTKLSLSEKYGQPLRTFADPRKMADSEIRNARSVYWSKNGKEIWLNFRKSGEFYEPILIVSDSYAVIKKEYNESEETRKKSDEIIEVL